MDHMIWTTERGWSFIKLDDMKVHAVRTARSTKRNDRRRPLQSNDFDSKLALDELKIINWKGCA